MKIAKLTDEQANNLMEWMRLSFALEECDNRKLLWLFTQAIRPWLNDKAINGVEGEIINQIENRLVPEYDGETFYMTETGWMTPDGPINYLTERPTQNEREV